jgi:hypothetical protein
MDEILKEYLQTIGTVQKANKNILDLIDAMIPLVASFDSAPVTQSFDNLIDAIKSFVEQLVLMHMQRLLE